MNRTKKTVAALAPVCAAAAFAASLPAHATAYLYVYDVNTSSDLCAVTSTSDGPLTCSGSVGKFSYTADTGLADTAGLPNLDLSFDAKGSGSDSLEISYYVSDAQGTGPTTFGTVLGGTALKGATGTFYGAYEDDVTFNAFGLVSTTPGAFSNTQFSGPYDLDTLLSGGEYYLGLFADLNLNGPKNEIISGDYNLQAYVPEPATLALFAAGLLGSAFGFRRRRG